MQSIFITLIVPLLEMSPLSASDTHTEEGVGNCHIFILFTLVAKNT